MRRPGNGDGPRATGRKPTPGLSDLLADDGHKDIRDYMSPTKQPGLLVMNAGSAAIDRYAVFSGGRLKELLGQASFEADLVVVDTPPLLGAAESQVISAGVDGSILVLDSTMTQPTAALEARDLLARSGANVLGVVLNRVNKSSAIRS